MNIQEAMEKANVETQYKETVGQIMLLLNGKETGEIEKILGSALTSCYAASVVALDGGVLTNDQEEKFIPEDSEGKHPERLDEPSMTNPRI